MTSEDDHGRARCMFQCPQCQRSTVSDVVDSRRINSGLAIRRRRVCEECHGRYTTYEMRVDPRTFESQRRRAKGVADQLRRMAAALEVW